ncbi:MAG TPA: response regulator transcription factor [Candidatus Saccharimonadales bacterium]
MSKILLIEDDHKVATTLRQGLEMQEFAADVAYDTDDGLDAALSQPYDLIILDRTLPGTMGGVDVCRAIRDKKIHTPILLLTVKDDIRDRAEGLNAGADDYLAKPFAFEELMTRVRALLRRPEDATDNQLNYHDLSLDTAAYEVRREGKLINLSRREFALLEYLMRNAERLLTKDTIIKHVWNFDAEVLPNTVEVYVGYLRGKIDKPFKGQPLITTVRGYGYRLGTPD